MATWQRNVTDQSTNGVDPNANLTLDGTLGGTAPGDFDAANITSIDLYVSLTGSGWSDDTWGASAYECRYSGGQIATGAISTSGNQNTTVTDGPDTDSTPATGNTPDTMRVTLTYSKSKGADGGSVQLDNASYIIITYTPAASSTPVSLDATTTVTAALSEKRFFDRAISATSTVTPALSRALTASRSFAASTTVTPVVSKTASFFRSALAFVSMQPQVNYAKSFSVSLDATSTVTPALSQQNYYDEPIAATSTVTPSLSPKSIRYISLAVPTTPWPAGLSRGGSDTTPVSLNATSTMTPAIGETFTAKRGIAATTTVAPALSKFGQFFRTLSATFTSTLGQLPGGGGQYAYRYQARRKHGDALWWFIQQNEQGNYTSRTLVGALNQLNGTQGIEYWEARATYLARWDEA